MKFRDARGGTRLIRNPLCPDCRNGHKVYHITHWNKGGNYLKRCLEEKAEPYLGSPRFLPCIEGIKYFVRVCKPFNVTDDAPRTGVCKRHPDALWFLDHKMHLGEKSRGR